MRVVQVCPYDLSRHGGVQQHILSLAAELRKRGHEVLVIGPGTSVLHDGQDLRIGRMRNVSFAGTSFELSLATKVELRALAVMLEEWRPDVIHYHTMWVPFLPRQIFRRTHVASVATFHDTPPPGPMGSVLRAAFKLMSWFLLRRLDGAIAVSPAPLAHLRPGRFGIQPTILPPATDLTGIFQALFPCGSVVGAPKLSTLSIIRGLEPRPRGPYCGAIGWATARDACFSVAIRTVEFEIKLQEQIRAEQRFGGRG